MVAMKVAFTLASCTAASILLSACAVELQNTQAAKELARESSPPGSVYIGWRVFQDRCARCHGNDATGAEGPDLLPRVRDLGPRRFVDLVLRRYEWNVPTPESAPGSASTDALTDAILERKSGALTMPAWEGEPRVQAHIAELHAYLSARADGRAGTGRPPQ